MNHNEYIRAIKNADTAVLMIHGILGTPRHFDFILPMIPDDWSIYNILLDGHGKNVSDFSSSSMNKWKSQVDKIADELCSKYKQIVLIGHSMGTLLSIRTAIRHPEKIKAMVLLAVPMKVFVKLIDNMASVKTALGIKVENSPYMEAVKNAHGTASDKRFWKYFGYIPRFLELFGLISETRKMLPDLKTKTYVFQSKKDELVAYSSKKYLENHEYIEYNELENSKHYYYEDSDKKELMKRIREIISLTSLS